MSGRRDRRSGDSSLVADDRAVSIAITHVMTIGITALLITGLLMGAGNLLDLERERGAESSLTTIGERLSGELSSVDRLADEPTDNVTLRVDHPRQVSGSIYRVELRGDPDDCDSPLHAASEACLVLTATDENVDVMVPVRNESPVTDSQALGGPITIVHEGGAISIESGHR